MKKVLFKIDGMHCTSCSLVIDGNLEDTKGVISARTDFHKGVSEVEYDEAMVNEDVLKEVVKKAGYTVQ